MSATSISFALVGIFAASQPDRFAVADPRS
jgi:hypothetical protein